MITLLWIWWISLSVWGKSKTQRRELQQQSALRELPGKFETQHDNLKQKEVNIMKLREQRKYENNRKYKNNENLVRRKYVNYENEFKLIQEI